MAPAGRALLPRVVFRVAPAALVLAGATPALAAGGPTVRLPVPVTAATQAAAATPSSGGGTPLAGTFRINAGGCSGAVSGSYFRMVQPGGSAAAGPFVSNSDSPCADKTYTPLSPGTDGGLRTGGYQPEPSPAFDSTGNGLAGLITQPQKFYGVNFAAATNRVDPQTGTSVSAPTVSSSGGRLGGDLRAFSIAWNNQHFNQGAPKPDGSRPGVTSGPSGTYDSATGGYRLDWTSQIVGGPFNNFAGVWHLEGTFVPSSSAASTSTSASSTGPDNALSPSGAAAGGSTGGAAAVSGTSGGTGGPSGALPTTGWNAPLGPLAGLLAGGLILRRLAGRRPESGAGS